MRPPIAQAFALLKEYYLDRKIPLHELRFRLTMFEEGKFEVRQVNFNGLVCDEVEKGVTTIEDPFAEKPGAYYFCPDDSGQFYQQAKLLDAFQQVANRVQREKIGEHNLAISESRNTFTIKVYNQAKVFFEQTFGKSSTLRECVHDLISAL